MEQRQQEKEVLEAVNAFAHSLQENRSVVADMSELTEATSRLPLAKLDYWERLIRWEFFKALESSKTPNWKFWSKRERFLTWVDISSGNGHTREKTLRTLSGPTPNAFFLALAMRRLNDWVPQVRRAAREKLPSIAESSDSKHVADVLCFTLAHWNSWGRMEEEDKQTLLNMASLEHVRGALKDKICTSTTGPMTAVLSQVGRVSLFDEELIDIAHDAMQPSVRARAYRSLLEGKVTWFEGREFKWTDVRYCEGRYMPVTSERELTAANPFLPTLKQAAFDRSPIVRRVAGEMLIRELSNLAKDGEELANLLANDSSPSVAERGRFAKKKLTI